MLGMTHRPHEGNHVLFDGCERCTEHANRPFDSLDDGHLGRLLKMTEAGIAYGDRVDSIGMNGGAGEFVSELDVQASQRIQTVLDQFNRIQRIWAAQNA